MNTDIVNTVETQMELYIPDDIKDKINKELVNLHCDMLYTRDSPENIIQYLKNICNNSYVEIKHAEYGTMIESICRTEHCCKQNNITVFKIKILNNTQIYNTNAFKNRRIEMANILSSLDKFEPLIDILLSLIQGSKTQAQLNTIRSNLISMKTNTDRLLPNRYTGSRRINNTIINICNISMVDMREDRALSEIIKRIARFISKENSRLNSVFSKYKRFRIMINTREIMQLFNLIKNDIPV